MDRYDHMKSVRKIQYFVAEDLSNWYIRRARRRFWAEELTQDKKAVYATTYEVLKGVSQLIAPFAPFIADEIYCNLSEDESVHISYFPEFNESLTDDFTEERMDLVRDMVGLGRGIREKERIKVRQPLRSILVDGKYASLIRDMVPLIKDELNVKEVIFEKDLTEYMSYSLKPDFKVAGPLLGGKIKAFAVALSKEDPADFVSRMKKEGGIHMELEGENVNITPEMTDIRIDAREGFAVAMEGNLFTILDTGLDRELVEEGLAREIVSKVQQLRKQKDFEMMDNIIISLDAGEEVKEAIKKYEKYIMKETLATEIKEDKTKEKYNINGHDTGIDVKKI